MSNVDKIAKDLAGIIKSSDSKGTAPYDTKATVKKVENGIAWVQIPGGVDETPVQMTLSAKAGDTVQVRVSGGRAWITGNGTNPPTDDTRANAAYKVADKAYSVADIAIMDAQRAHEAADSAEASAGQAHEAAESASAAATRAETKADTASAAASRAETAAGNAETSAANAQSSADSALVGLSTVQDVVGVLNWITAHGTMTSQSGGTFDADQVYFIQDNNGDYTVGGVRYSLVAEPKAADINSYYVLTVDESVQNYVATHIVVDSEGLWIIPDVGGNKVLIATGNGSTYTTAGTYIIGKVNNVDKVLAKFITTGATVGQTGGAHSVIDADGQRFYARSGTTQLANIGYGEGASESGTAVAPYYTFGVRKSGSAVGNYSMAEGQNVISSGYTSHAEGQNTKASADCAHAEGGSTTASGEHGAHAEGGGTTASGESAHAEGGGTTASGICAHAEGDNAVASGYGAHAEGTSSVASGSGSHAEGDSSKATAQGSHAQNLYTEANYEAQTAIGKYNKNKSGNAFEIGNGTNDNNRSNAFTVDWSGNVDIASGAKYKINGTDLSASDIGAIPTTRKVNNKALSSDITLTASDVSALPISGGTITGNLTVNGDTTLEGVTYLGLDVDSSASKTTPATSGEDKDLFNAIRVLGWYDDVIE